MNRAIEQVQQWRGNQQRVTEDAMKRIVSVEARLKELQLNFNRSFLHRRTTKTAARYHQYKTTPTL